MALDTSEATGETIQNRLMKNLNAHNLKENRPYSLSITMGMARYNPEKPFSLEDLIEKADKCMYEYKQKRSIG